MTYLILAVLFGASLSVCFKLFRRLGIDTLQAVFFNYLTAIAVSLIMSGGIDMAAVVKAPWIWLAVVEGLFFMGGIVVMAASTQRVGVAVTSVSARASLALPVIACHIVFHEAAPSWVAIALILIAMLLIFGIPGDKREKHSIADSLLPVSVFLMYGACDFLLKLLKAQIGTDGNHGNIMLIIFSTAGLFSVAAYLLRGRFADYQLSWKAVPGGIVLGLFNSFCTAFMMKALGVMDAVLFYPLYNVGVVIFSLAVGIVFFRERLRPVQLGGVALAILAIVLLLVA